MAEMLLSSEVLIKEEFIGTDKYVEEQDIESFPCKESPSCDDPLKITGETSDLDNDSAAAAPEHSAPCSPVSNTDSVSNIFEPEVNIEFEGDEDEEDEYIQSNTCFNYQSDEDYEPSKSSKKDNREKNYQCPLCGKFFLTSSAMNGHVSKGHGTTLGVKFTCHVCGAPGSSRASLKRHLMRTHKLKNVDHPELLTKKCTHCNHGFASYSRLYEHIRSDHKLVLHQYHHCSYCPALMRAKASLHRHIRRAHPGKEEPASSIEKCHICEETFNTRYFLQRHMRNVHPESPRHVCSVCNAGFKFPYMLSKHMMSHESTRKYEDSKKKKKYSVACEFCDRQFGSKPRLEYHVEVVHTNPPVKIYTCRMCGLTFPSAKQNNRHYRKVHRPERQKIHCGKCNITFATPEECSQHRALHPNTCEICQKQFLRRDSLREHLLIHSAPRHQCPHCSKKFTQRSNLKRHIRVHTGEKPYKCPYCTRRFSDKSACNSHVRVHTGYERSVCSICGASFSKKQRLNYHMRIHTGEGLLYCPLCMRPSTNSYSLRKHIESHQQPLTKALASIGFKPLLDADKDFVIKALKSLTHATLRSMSRHENIPNSFIEEVEEMGDSNGLLSKASLEKDVDECANALSDIAKIEAGGRADTGSIQPKLECDEADDSPFSLAKFLQSLLEKERRRLMTERQQQMSDGNNVSEFLNALSPDRPGYDGLEEKELPETIGDDLVKQCLEIIMKDEESDEEEEEEEDFDEGRVAIKMEPKDVDEDDEEDDEDYDDEDFDDDVDDDEDDGEEEEDGGMDIPNLKFSSNEKELVTIKKEVEEVVFSDPLAGEWDNVEPFADEREEGRSKLKQLLQGRSSSSSSKRAKSNESKIPKIKISRVGKSSRDDDSSEDIFVAEIVRQKS